MMMRGRQLALGCLDELSRIRWRPRHSIGLRSIHLMTPNYDGETLIAQQREHPVSPAIAGSRWVMLSTCLRETDTVSDAKTVAESTTTRGRGFRVSADLAALPASSFLCYDGEDPDIDPDRLVAAHGDPVLFGFTRSSGNTPCTYEYFVYRAAAAGRPPSLSPPLPTHDFSYQYDEGPTHMLHEGTTGILHRGEHELLVVELGDLNQSESPSSTIDLNVLRVGSLEWEMWCAVPVVDVDGRREYGLEQWTRPDRVIAIGDRFLCWVKYSSGFLLCVCDMADPNLVLRSMPLPVAPRQGRRRNGRYIYYKDEDNQMQYCRNICGAGADALRFVSIDPRCCCGGLGRGTCPHSSFAFTVTTWTMSLRMEEGMAWVMDRVLDCEEIWALPGYEGLPCVPPNCPVVSPGNPDVICFKLSNFSLLGSSDDQVKVWMLEVDIRRKVLLSVVQCPEEPEEHLPAKF